MVLRLDRVAWTVLKNKGQATRKEYPSLPTKQAMPRLSILPVSFSLLQEVRPAEEQTRVPLEERPSRN